MYVFQTELTAIKIGENYCKKVNHEDLIIMEEKNDKGLRSMG